MSIRGVLDLHRYYANPVHRLLVPIPTDMDPKGSDAGRSSER